MIWASIDPGLNHCGVAQWDGDTLVHAKLVKTQARKGMSLSERAFWMAAAVKRYLNCPHAEPVPPVQMLLIELPRTYGGKAKKGDANKNIIPLSLVIGALLPLAPRVDLVWPSDWKGTVEPDAFIRRESAKVPAETVSKIDFPCKSLEHNVWDAVLLGIWKNKKK